MRGLLKPFLIVAGAAFALLAVVVLAFFVFFPKDFVVREVEKQIETALNRDLEIKGPVNVSLWPTLGFSAEQVTLSNPEGFADQSFLSAKRIDFAIAIMPLFHGSAEIKALVLNGAELNLAAKPDGTVNWAFPTKESADQKSTIADLKLDDVRLIDSALHFAPASGAPMEVSDITMSLSMASLDAPAETKGGFTYRGEHVDASITAGLPRAFLEQTSSPLKAHIKAKPIEADFDGAFDAKTGGLDGQMKAGGASLRALLAWMGSPLPAGGGPFARYDVSGHYTSAGERMSLADCALKLDALDAHGNLVLDMPADKTMKVSGALNMPALDANPYLPAAPEGAQAEGVTASAAWSEAPLDLSGLKAVDADLNLSVGAFTFQRMKFSDVALALHVANGAMDAKLNRLSGYGGAGTARLIADGRSATPRVALDLNIDNVDARSLLSDAIGFDKIEGHGHVTASLVGAGASQAALMRTLQGTSSIAFKDGAFKGVNLGNVARTVEALRSGAAPTNTQSETDFSDMSASFQLAEGVASTTDLKLASPFLRLDGQGLINIGAQSLDMRVSPRAVASSAGQGGAADARGIGVPFHISGSWAAPKYAPDVGDAVRSALRDQAQRALRNRAAGDPLRQLGDALFGDQPAASAASSETASTDAPASDTTTETTPAEQTQQTPEQPRTPEQQARDALGDLLRRH